MIDVKETGQAVPTLSEEAKASLGAALSRVLFTWHHGPESTALCTLVAEPILVALRTDGWLVVPPGLQAHSEDTREIAA